MGSNNILPPKKYNYIDCILIPLKVSPLFTLITILNDVINGLLPSLSVIATTKFIDAVLGVYDMRLHKNAVIIPLLFILSILAYQYLNRALLNFLYDKFNIVMSERIEPAIYEKRARLKYEHIENDKVYELISRTCSDVPGHILNGMALVLQVVSLIITFVSLMTLLVSYAWWSAFCMFLATIPVIILSVKSGKSQYEINKKANYHNCRSGYLHGLTMYRDYVYERTLFSYTDYMNRKWMEQYNFARKMNLTVILKNLIRTRGVATLTLACFMGTVVVLINPLHRGAFSVGVFIGLVQALINISGIISYSLSRTIVSLSRFGEYLKDLSLFTQLTETPGALELPNRLNKIEVERIEFSHVYFKYPGTEKEILKDFNVVIEKNKHYALVGVNGAGKTTITKLLTGLYDNYEGSIYINNKELRQYNLFELKSLFSVVYQDFAHYAISIEDNIALGDVNCFSDLRVDEAIDSVGLTEMVSKLSNHKKTVPGKIEEDSVDFSGGEWQRIAIARSIYSNAEISILDEPTASLDPVSESKVYEMFSNISVGKTTIFITHRMGAASLADEIIVIDDGCVKEKGSHNELICFNGLYASLYETQRSWYK